MVIFFEDINGAALSKLLACICDGRNKLLPHLSPKLGHRVLINADDIPAEMASGSKCNIAVRIRNASTITWPAWDKSGLTLGNRWLDQAGAVIKWIDSRVPLPRQAALSTDHWPLLTGLVQLSVDVVEERNCWFNLPQNAPFCAQVEITN
jgi:hypothetical protein